MESRVKVFGHSLHQMLIVFPLGLLATAVVFDVIHLASGAPRWAGVSYWLIVAGVVGGVAAAPAGLIDWLAIPRGTRAKAVGMWHGLGNVVVLVLFAASGYLRCGCGSRGRSATSRTSSPSRTSSTASAFGSAPF